MPRGKKSKKSKGAATTQTKAETGSGETNKVRVRVRWFEPRMMKVGPVSIEVLVPSKVVVLEEVAESPLDALINVFERLSSEETGIFEVEVSDGIRQIMGVMPRGKGRTLLFPRPARLLAVGVLTVRDAINKGAHGGTALFKIPQDSITMRRVRREVYVYEGRVEAPEDAYLLILDTDQGRRYVRLAREPIVSPLVQHVLTRPLQDEESHDSEPGTGGDSSPSG